MTSDTKAPYYIEIRKQLNGEFYWVQCDTSNHKIVARGESHPTYQNAVRAWETIEQRMGLWTSLNPKKAAYEIRDMRKPDNSDDWTVL